MAASREERLIPGDVIHVLPGLLDHTTPPLIDGLADSYAQYIVSLILMLALTALYSQEKDFIRGAR